MPPEASLRQSLQALPSLCRPDGSEAASWLRNPTTGRIVAALLMILLGGGAYGYSLGVWRAPEMGVYVAIKLPLLLLLVCGINGLLNGMLAQLLGGGIGFRQTLLSMLMSFSLFSLIVGSLSPITLGLALSVDGPGSSKQDSAYAIILLVNVLVFTFAGVMSHLRFFPGLVDATGNRIVALRIFLAWLAGNLFVGAQLSWNLRPFFGHPGNAPEFLRETWNKGNFYETLSLHAATLLGSGGLQITAFVILAPLSMYAFLKLLGSLFHPTYKPKPPV
jgi:hypothetical protein